MLAEVAVSAVMWAVPPAPLPAPAVHIGECPTMALPVMGCYIGEPVNQIWLAERNRYVFEHENGHAYDEHALSAGERAAIRRAMGWGAWHAERFADFYAGCRLREVPSDDTAWQYRPFRSVSRVAARCKADREGWRMKWFVYTNTTYYPYAYVVEADTADAAMVKWAEEHNAMIDVAVFPLDALAKWNGEFDIETELGLLD